MMLVAPLHAVAAEIVVNGRPSVVLESPAARLVIDLGGGSIGRFSSRRRRLEPAALAQSGR